MSLCIQKLQSLIINHRYHIDDILAIIRPFVYTYAVLKCGRRSYQPLKIALALDSVMLLTTMARLVRDEKKHGKKLKNLERRYMVRRVWLAVLKYAMRDPLFERYTKPYIEKVFQILRVNPTIRAIILSIMNYFRYYTYIA